MRIRAVLRIARWEAGTGAYGFDRRTLVLVGVALLALAATVPLAAVSGTPPDADVYRVGVSPGDRYYGPVSHDAKFLARPPDEAAFEAGNLDLLIRDGSFYPRDTPKGRAAAGALRAAVEDYNDRLMAGEDDRAAAFPVRVAVVYADREAGGIGVIDEEAGEREGTADEAGGTITDDGSGESSSGPTGTPDRSTAQSSGGGVDFVSSSLLGRSTGTPSAISPPFPFVSLVLAFAFVIPMNFVIQAYASSILHERTNRRGELLLIVPVSRGTVIAGKTLPYFAAIVVIAAVTAVALGGGLVSLAAVVPVALLFLACGFVGALLARSHKELTFVLVTVSVVVTTFVFVPAIFTDIHPIAAISPLTLVVRDLEGARVSAGTFVFSTVPVLVTAGALFGLGAGLYREEDLFTQRPIPAKVLDALGNPARGPRSAAVLSLLSIPFVFLAELLAVALLFVLPAATSLPILLAVIAGIEEVAKSLHVYAGFERDRYARTLRTACVVGAFSGFGFFVGEKATALAQLVGLMQIDLGRVAFQLSAGVGGASGFLLLVVFLAPLAMHVLTATVTAVGASRGIRAYAVTLGVAIFAHTLYNLAVVVILG